MHLKEKILYTTLASLIVLSFTASYYRFVILKDYIVAYEHTCDPTFESCFVGCNDDACESQYYYAVIEKMTYDVYQLCGNDVTNCDEAYLCKENDTLCNVIYCDPASIIEETCSSNNNSKI